MMKKLIVLVVLVLGIHSVQAQDLNKYKYVVVPESFEKFDEVNKYQLNALMKFLFEKQGFEVIMKGEDKPAELVNNPCLGLNASLEDDSNLFTTKVFVHLKDCQGAEVYKSQEGRTKEKDYKTAYQAALRDAFTSIEELNYSYDPSSAVVVQTSKPKTTVKTPAPVTVTAVPQIGNTTETSAVNESTVGAETISESSVNSAEKVYTYNSVNYILNETDKGFSLQQQNQSEPIALLITTDDGNYIYSSLTRQGVAYFDASGNLIIEYFNAQEGKKVKQQYKLNN